MNPYSCVGPADRGISLSLFSVPTRIKKKKLVLSFTLSGKHR